VTSLNIMWRQGCPYTDYEDQLHQRVIDNGLEKLKMPAEQKMQDWKMPHQN